MISEADTKAILEKAYIPEHIVPLMALLSKGEPFLIEDFLCLVGNDWLIVVGYPLETAFQESSLKRVVKASIKRFRPTFGWIMAPEEPAYLQSCCGERESDRYYVYDLNQTQPPKRLFRIAERAAEDLRVERHQELSKDHWTLIEEFIAIAAPKPRVEKLYLSLPKYVSLSPTAIILSAWTREQHLSAFYVIELAATRFASYLAGCYSRRVLVPHASDLLFYEMILLAKTESKNSINLGLGVNDGIRRFKEKWGGMPSIAYEYCEFRSKSRWVLNLLGSFAARG
jgi:hypothetical protein